MRRALEVLLHLLTAGSLGLAVGMLDLIGTLTAGSLLQAFKGAPFGMHFSLFGWLSSQVKTFALDLLGFYVLGLAFGFCLLPLLLPGFIKPESAPGGRERGRRRFYSVFMFMFLVFLLATALVFGFVYAVYHPLLSSWMVGAAGMVCVGFLFWLCFVRLARRLRESESGREWAVAGVFLFSACFFIFGLKVAFVFPELKKGYLGFVSALGFTVFLGVASFALFRGLLRSLPAMRPFRVQSYFSGTALFVSCLLLAAIRGFHPSPGVMPALPGRKNIIFLVWDTVRADHLSVYGYKRRTTPFLEELAREGALFSRAFSTAPWTLPSHASFFTGLYSSEHRCTHEHLWLEKDFVTLAEIFRARGYVTVGYSNNPLVGRMSRLDQGFNTFVEGWRPEVSGFLGVSLLKTLSIFLFPDLFPADAGAARSLKTINRWLSELARSGSPFFLFINWMEAHPPMPRHQGAFSFLSGEAKAMLLAIKEDFMVRNAGLSRLSPGEKDALIRLYDGEIKYLDEKTKELVQALERTGLSKNTILVILSDHGEMLDEHGGLWGHERTLYHSLLHVPLLMWSRSGQIPEGMRAETPISLKHLPELALQLAEGEPLPAALRNALEKEQDELGGLLAEVARPVTFIKVLEKRFPARDWKKLDRRQKALIRYPWKLIWDSRGEDALFNLEQDPEELNNLWREEFPRYREMSLAIEKYRALHPGPAAEPLHPPLDPETMKKLRALGYLP